MKRLCITFTLIRTYFHKWFQNHVINIEQLKASNKRIGKVRPSYNLSFETFRSFNVLAIFNVTSAEIILKMTIKLKELMIVLRNSDHNLDAF